MRLTDALRVELAPLGVSVMLAAPGFIQTRARDTASDLAASYNQRGVGTGGHSLWTGWCVCASRQAGLNLWWCGGVTQHADGPCSIAHTSPLPLLWCHHTLCRLQVLEAAMRKRLEAAVPADRYASALSELCLTRQRLPRCVIHTGDGAATRCQHARHTEKPHIVGLPAGLLVCANRCWVGPCAGIEWAIRFFPAWLQDSLTARAMGLVTLTPVLQQNAAALREPRQAAGAAHK
jgi:hypothetical protein